MVAGVVLLVVAAGLGIFWIAESLTTENPIIQTSATGSFIIDVTDNNLDNGEEITEETDSAG